MQHDPTRRALLLLSLLQTHRFWRSSELADRLEVTDRTVRRDIDRLRELGYPVDATSGIHGGYRLAAGAHLPPLLLEDDEAVAVAVGLRTAAHAAIDGIEDTSVRALTKIETLLPHRLRRRVSALHSSVSAVRQTNDDDHIDPESLSVFAAACRDHEVVKFDYRRGDGELSRRRIQPHHLVAAGRRWYLVAWDEHRDDWRTFRLDRILGPIALGSHFAPRVVPGSDPAAYVAASLGTTARISEGTILIRANRGEVDAVMRWFDHTVIESNDDHSVVLLRCEDLGRLTLAVARSASAAAVTAIDPPALTTAVAALASHLSRVEETPQDHDETIQTFGG